MFDNEKVVDDILADGNMIEMNGSRVSLVIWLFLIRIVYPSSPLLRSIKLQCNLLFFLHLKSSFIICWFINLRTLIMTIWLHPAFVFLIIGDHHRFTLFSSQALRY